MSYFFKTVQNNNSFSHSSWPWTSDCEGWTTDGTKDDIRHSIFTQLSGIWVDDIHLKKLLVSQKQQKDFPQCEFTLWSTSSSVSHSDTIFPFSGTADGSQFNEGDIILQQSVKHHIIYPEESVLNAWPWLTWITSIVRLLSTGSVNSGFTSSTTSMFTSKRQSSKLR